MSRAIFLAVALAARAGMPATGGEARDFFNVIAPDGADPSVLRHSDGRYYATITTGGDVTLWRSETLSGLYAGEKKVIWTPPDSGPKSKDIWAPELARLRGKWYVYFAADDGDNANHRMYALENDAADPFEGQFVEKGKVFDRASDRWAIDGAALELGDRLYFAWSGWEGVKSGSQGLYIAPMSDPLTVSGPRVEISRPTFDWEVKGAPPSINEGPQFLVHGRSVHLAYSASGSWTDDYCVGMLTADVDSDLLAPKSWKKSPQPVLRRKGGIVGPGHCTFTTSPDGKQDWIVYHAARYPGAGWNREVRLQPLTWDRSGLPLLGDPLPPDSPIPLPGGEPTQSRFEAEAMTLGRAAKVVPDPHASGGSKVVFQREDEGADAELSVIAKEPGSYNVSIRFRNAAIRKPPAPGTLIVNGGKPLDLDYAPTGAEDWSCLVRRVELKAGANRLRFVEGDEPLEMDCVAVFPAHPALAPPK